MEFEREPCARPKWFLFWIVLWLTALLAMFPLMAHC